MAYVYLTILLLLYWLEPNPNMMNNFSYIQYYTSRVRFEAKKFHLV